MKKLVLVGVSLFLLSCQKTTPISSDNNNVEEQIAAVIKKYPNLSIVHTSVSNSKAITVNSLQEFEDSVAALSNKALSIKVITDTSEIKKLDSVYGQSKVQSQHATLASAQSGGSGIYAWHTVQYVGNSEAGDYPVYYYASFNYYTSPPPEINYITSVTNLSSSSPTATSEQPHSPGYYEYTYNYTQASSGYALSGENQIATLAFNGTVSLICTYTFFIYTAQVSATSKPLSENPTVFSSTFPKTFVP
ncbi:hypothetical protein [Arachidicoccus sp.]|uniref:hypothetical protein n=1 Tax=Arachidicoccus sp. TaxID=1872624 RepID=UPI003D19591B